MKRLFIPVLLLSVCHISNSQVPQGFNYQAIARDGSGDLITNTAISVRLTIQSDSLGGTVFWQELHSDITTNDLGLFTLIVGKGVKQSGTAVTFEEIDWTVTPKYVMVEVDYGGWKTMGSSRLWTVPYAMHSKSSDSSIEYDPLFTASPANEVTLVDISNWDAAFSWGNHALEGYLKSFTETDPIFNSSPAAAISAIEISNWNNSFSWGDHAAAGYVPETRTITINGSQYDLSANRSWNLGTVTSVSLTMPSIFSVTGSPITSAGTISASLNSQLANMVFASPDGSAGIPSFRSLQPLDIPGLDWSKIITGKPITLAGYGITDAVSITGDQTIEGNKTFSGVITVQTPIDNPPSMEESLFEVKNKNGQTVFAVYNEGVRIYVDDGNAKGLKGGFAIGGLNPAKGTGDLFIVNADSIRAYIDTNPAKGVKGGFAIGGLNPAKDTPQDLFIVSPDSIRAYIYDDPLTKPIKGGFAIGGFNNAKGITNDYLLISPDSIRAYIDTDPAKALKGGFAIGGINTAKAGTEEYLRVTRDSTRVYINDLPAKGLKGGFAIGGINTAKGNARYFDVALDTSSIINPSQNRINWYPKKNAFLTGRILIETPDSVGENSFASGYESKSIGGWSQALGYKAIARGDYSTAIGKNAVANEINSFAFGEDAKAKNDESYAIGRGAIANGYRSFAFGSAGVDSIGNVTDVARALGDYSFALGQGSVTMSHGAFALGVEDSSSADFSFAMGYRAVASGYGSFSVGFNTKSSAPFSIALGSRGIASGTGSFSVGTSNTASGHESVAMGFVSSAKNEYAFVMGDYSEATGRNSFSVGHRTSARGNCSAAFNNSCIAIGNSSSAFGANSISVGGGSFATGISSKATSLACFVIGQYNDTTSISQNTWIDTDPIFIVGNGTSELNRKNVYTIYKNGNVYMKGNLGIGITPTHLIHLSGGAYSNGVTWTNVSDQNLKENFEIVDSEVILHMIEELPITRWNYKSENSSIKHIGPVAQDFYTIFGLGTDDKSISTVDPSGIALVAIKQLSKENKSLKEQVESYRSQLQLLQQEVEQIKALLELNNLR